MPNKGGINILKRLFFSLLIILLAFWTKPLWGDSVHEFIPESINDTFQSVKEFAIQMIDNNFYIDQVQEQFPSSDVQQNPEQEPVEKPDLSIPDEQSVSIGNIELGDTKDEVNEMYGEPMRESENEYGLDWFTYHENYQNFIMVAYDHEIVRGLFTNQDLLSSQFDIAIGDTKTVVNETLGEPEELIHYNRFSYQINSEDEYDVYRIDENYVTIFYDIHQDNEMTAIQLIDEDLETTKDVLYTPSSETLKEGFEYQLFDLTNATRINHGLTVLEWDEEVRETARKHSTDMAENQFFSHTNLQGHSLSDRMSEDEVAFITAGENLAYGQFNSIFAHQGLMNSEGHRENILHDDFTKLGVGVDFNDENQPFYTENFFAN
ncbi:CAP domain-containing protein [Amphibacillus sp. Q70]|uniref:CAP domain-containing protein n=1 Tax=Amphibacillus sp. Q70 TaxID=3453416 RepID=UPI003F83D003